MRVWDSVSGECVAVYYLLPDGETYALDQKGLLSASAGAWRWLGIRANHPKTGEAIRVPIEALYEFGENGYRRSDL